VKLLFDTSVWVDHLRQGSLAEVIPLLRGRYVLLIESVAIAELLGGCRSKRERNVIEKLCAPFKRAERVLHPEPGDFRRAALSLSRLRESGKTLKNPGAALLDGLIAAVASREGALLVTLNVGDFDLLGSQLPLRWQRFHDFSAALKSMA
jgi:predicted nucleic acid-binding protein